MVLGDGDSGGKTTARVRIWTIAGLLATCVCAAFGCTASAGLGVAVLANVMTEDAAFVWRCFLKAGVLGGVLALSATGLVQLTRSGDGFGRLPEADGTPAPRGGRWALAAALGFAALLTLPRLDAYPKPEPDELHHLIVAKNLAQYGVYGSGHPDTGFIRFDPYDSVGAPVLVPVAGAFRTFGKSLVSARLVMAAYFVALCGVAYLFMRPVFGVASAIASAAMLATAPMSVYLGRSLYGEVPAFLFFLVGLLAWRRALARETVLWSLLAGSAFGVAVLCKSILVLAAFTHLPEQGACKYC